MKPLAYRVTKQLAELRRKRGITQEKLAELLDIPVQHVSRVEAGGQNITLGTLERFLAALGYAIEIEFRALKAGPKRPPPSKRQEKRRR